MGSIKFLAASEKVDIMDLAVAVVDDIRKLQRYIIFKYACLSFNQLFKKFQFYHDKCKTYGY